MNITEYEKDFYILDNGEVRAFLIIGETRAVLIDTCYEKDHIIEVVNQLTNKPIEVVLTHGDRDHIGGLHDFKRCRIHIKDSHFIQCPISISYLRSKDQINIGNYCFEVIDIPGHTYGSIALLDRKKKLLLPGDSVQKGPIYMFGEHRNLDMYIESLNSLQYIKDIQIILPSHHEYPLGREYINHCLEDAMALKNHELTGVAHPTMPCSHYIGKNIEFYY